MSNRFTVVPAVYIIVRRDDKVLFIRRANTGYHDGLYALPAGHIDGGEPAHIAAIREAKEEVGITIAPDDVQLKHVMHRFAEEADHERVDFFFEVTKYAGEPSNNEPEKCDDIQWFSLADLPENTSPVCKSALEMIAADQVYSSHNF